MHDGNAEINKYKKKKDFEMAWHSIRYLQRRHDDIKHIQGGTFTQPLHAAAAAQ